MSQSRQAAERVCERLGLRSACGESCGDTHDLHDRGLCLSSFPTGFMDGDRAKDGICREWYMKEMANKP